MNKLQSKIMNMDFKKTAKRFIVLSLIIVIVGGILTGLMFRTQISEAITYHQTYENSRENRMQEETTRYNEEYREDGQWEHGFEKADFFESVPFTVPTVGAQIVLFTYAVLCALIGLVYWLLVMAWLYQAAFRASMNRTLWTILGLFFNLAAVVAFLIVRSLQTVCPSCGTYQKAGAFCRACGVPLQIKCTECGVLADGKDKYCSNCGKQIAHDNTDKIK
ncbi:zinc ribbon domain-containing protein [Bacillaceae bacterium Marseille-Q3522]|nr:zinc ribbon domain-containing protein [Bacillaceae bacterium Marseille-Q3522]